METVEIEGQQFEVKEHAADGLPVIKGHPTTVYHKDENGEQIYDENGFPKISVHISVSPVSQEPITPKEQE